MKSSRSSGQSRRAESAVNPLTSMNTFQNYGAILMTDLHFLVIVRPHIITRQSIIINLDIILATPAQVPSDSADGGSSAQSCARLN